MGEQKKTLPIEGENQTRTVDIHPVNNQSKTESVRNQSDTQLSQREQEHALPTQGESLARTAYIQSVNDSVRNRSDTQVEQQTQELKKHNHVSEPRRKEKKNITDKLKYESVDNQNDVQ